MNLPINRTAPRIKTLIKRNLGLDDPREPKTQGSNRPIEVKHPFHEREKKTQLRPASRPPRALPASPDSDAPVHRRHARRGGWRPRRKPRDFCTPRASTVRVSAVPARVGRASRFSNTIEASGGCVAPSADPRPKATGPPSRAPWIRAAWIDVAVARPSRRVFSARLTRARRADDARAHLPPRLVPDIFAPTHLPPSLQTSRRPARRASPTSGTWRTRSPAPPHARSWRWHPWAARPTSPRARSASLPRGARSRPRPTPR